MSSPRSAQGPAAIAQRCPACGGDDIRTLPELPRQSMRSDGRVVPQGLRRIACAGCGLAMHSTPTPAWAVQETFAIDYQLYAHRAGSGFERDRQRRYADWIRGISGTVEPGTVLEIGCGNGSLMLALRDDWKSAAFKGIEPAAAAVHHARAAGLAVEQGFVEAGDPNGETADMVIAVNVLEHAHDPIRFLSAFRNRMRVSGRGIIVCPDGAHPSAELLIHDHLFSMTGHALHCLCHAAGLGVTRHELAPPGLAGFQAILVEHAGGTEAPVAPDNTFASRLFAARTRFFQHWQDLDVRLQQRMDGLAEIGCFGIGETANLLRAYAPGLWRRFSLFTVDGGAGMLDGRPLHDYATLRPRPGRVLVPAVRQEIQTTVIRRLESDGHRVIAWDDLAAA